MLPHTHLRRSEVYLYFNVHKDQRVIHLMGPPRETRSLVIANKQVVVSPDWSIHAGVFVPSYAAAKGGVGQLTKAFANEWASKGINVNAIAPGYMATDNTAVLRKDPERSRQILEGIPAGRWGLPSDLAGAAVFLASAASDYVHGHIMVIDGGWLGR